MIYLAIIPVLGQKITWIKSITGRTEQNGNQRLFDKIFKFVFGGEKFSLIHPVGIYCLEEDALWILDQGLQSAAIINFNQAKLIKLFSKQNYPSPVSICSGPSQSVYFTDSALNKIFVSDPVNDEVVEFAEDYAFRQPTGIAWHPGLNQVFISETGMHRILVFDNTGKLTGNFGERGRGEGQFNFPTYLWIDKNGLLYVVDSMNFRVQIFSPSGEVVSIFGEQGNSSGYMARPKGIATDSEGHIYVVDGLFHSVQIFDRNGQFLDYFGKQGKGDAEFWLPSGIYIDAQDRIFVADSYNSRIQVFQYVSGQMDGQ